MDSKGYPETTKAFKAEDSRRKRTEYQKSFTSLILEGKCYKQTLANGHIRCENIKLEWKATEKLRGYISLTC
jgi:hypothetical protein